MSRDTKSYTPEQLADVRAAIAAAQRRVREYVHRKAADDSPTIPAPPPDPAHLRPTPRVRPPNRPAPWDDKPTTPPPFPAVQPNDPRYPT